ncbi:hypothetical protein L1049_024228 [Liquidambar formosana]|uniref:Peptidase M24 C-terminal domain-containing protein n=1 Tax=Liquidambar formosana TaxID=63359 RepID=A0AAP0RVS4_LIQFO
MRQLSIIHHMQKTCAEFDVDSIYLFDSGAQVLKGHVALGNAHFPNGTNGHSLDILARIPLWKDGLDYRHEPGYYEDGSFGIRLENVLIVKEANTKFNFGDKGYLSFEHVTWAPYQRKLMDLGLLIPEEIDWLNTYHSNCREILAPYLDDSEMAWLKKATEPISA